MTLEQRLRHVPPRDRVAAAIRWSGLQQAELADSIGISRRMMGYLLHTQRKPLAYLPHLRLANKLHVDPGVLAGLPEPARDVTTHSVEVPQLWRVFADAHNMPVTRLVAEAVEEYISASEAEEHGYAPDVLATHDYPQVVIMPTWVLKWLLARALSPDRTAISPDETDALVSVFGRKELCNA